MGPPRRACHPSSSLPPRAYNVCPAVSAASRPWIGFVAGPRRSKSPPSVRGALLRSGPGTEMDRPRRPFRRPYPRHSHHGERWRQTRQVECAAARWMPPPPPARHRTGLGREGVEVHFRRFEMRVQSTRPELSAAAPAGHRHVDPSLSTWTSSLLATITSLPE